ncbi:MAG: hypothetical protein EHM70_09860 [Chloroflexota bacterium]|nr:MAG: hypothetical protein EHM70_09860 [Chloroflexota bacterium]
MSGIVAISPATSRLELSLKVACAVLIVLVASQVALSLAGIPLYYQRVTTASVPTLVVGSEVRMSNDLVNQWAAERGMSLHTYALYSILLNLTITIGFTLVAALILLKARRQWFHWFTALVLLFIPTGGLWEFTMVSQVGYRFVTTGGLLWPIFLLFLYLFPNGRAVPRWTRWLIGPLAVLHLALQAINLVGELSYASGEVMDVVFRLFPLVLAAFPLIILCQVYRYMRVSTPVERAQTRWFVAGLILSLALGQFIEFATGVNSNAAATETGLGGDLEELMMLIIPASIGIGILRYRLYDIDVIIRRTLVYGLLTATLALLYYSVVIVIQQVANPLTGATGQSSFAVVISTLAIAFLFNPLRRRIQNFIDRRFYRRRYNAEEILQSFSGSLRNEVNLDQLSGHLRTVVQETMQPAHISMWLRKNNLQARERPLNKDASL